MKGDEMLHEILARNAEQAHADREIRSIASRVSES